MVGADKLMWGSDYPRTITAITYKMSYDFILKTNDLTDKGKKDCSSARMLKSSMASTICLTCHT